MVLGYFLGGLNKTTGHLRGLLLGAWQRLLVSVCELGVGVPVAACGDAFHRVVHEPLDAVATENLSLIELPFPYQTKGRAALEYD